jgi:1-acyl-sn-glycerol-3-phosphate acyltransferase
LVLACARPSRKISVGVPRDALARLIEIEGCSFPTYLSGVIAIPAPSPGLRSFLRTSPGRTVLSLVIDYFHATLEGALNIPREGGALIVSNHALFALDTAVLGALIVRDLGRNPRFLADRMLWKIPGFRQFIAAIGALPGEPQAAEQLLRMGELVVVYPGGVDDSLKLTSERYQLKWKDRAGFARVAMAAKVPIVPVVGFGIDEMYSVVGYERWMGRRLFGSARYDLPIAFGAFGTLLPRRVKQTYVALPAIDTAGDPNMKEDVERVRRATRDAIETHLSQIRIT